jgi:hypothetical protein
MKAENCIFTQDKNKLVTDTKNLDAEYYTILGDHDFIDDNNKPRTKEENKKTLAKTTTTHSSKKFYIKTGTYGRIYNPMGMFSEGKSEKFLAKIGRKEYNFKEVNQLVFDMYLNFLSTKNIAWLNNAEREMI